MTPEEAVYTYLNASPQVLAIVGPDIFPIIPLQELPIYITYRRLNADAEYDLSGQTVFEWVDVRVDYYADEFGLLEDLAQAIRDAVPEAILDEEHDSKAYHGWIVFRFFAV